MATRKSIYCLSSDELSTFIDALLKLKAKGDFQTVESYDWFTRVHADAMTTCRKLPTERCFFGGIDPRRPTGRNSAHQGPAFLTWHRQFLFDMEEALQVISGDPNLGIPYWPWDIDGSLASPESQPLWSAGFIGSDGDPANGDFITDGPFKDWDALLRTADGQYVYRSRLGVCRQLGRAPAPQGSSTLVDGNELEESLFGGHNVYDADPWDIFSTAGFRNPFEFLHNRVHRWVGGDMLPPTSPNDPVFYLHHCNVDRLWASWQTSNGSGIPYLPISPAPEGHGVSDFMKDLGTSTTVTPDSVYDPALVDYQPPSPC